MKITEFIKDLDNQKNNHGDLDVVISSVGIDGFGGYMSDDIKLQLSSFEDESFIAIEANYNLYTGRKKKTVMQSKEQLHEWARLKLKKWAEGDKSDSELIVILCDTIEKLQNVLIKKYDIS